MKHKFGKRQADITYTISLGAKVPGSLLQFRNYAPLQELLLYSLRASDRLVTGSLEAWISSLHVRMQSFGN